MRPLLRHVLVSAGIPALSLVGALSLAGTAGAAMPGAGHAPAAALYRPGGDAAVQRAADHDRYRYRGHHYRGHHYWRHHYWRHRWHRRHYWHRHHYRRHCYWNAYWRRYVCR
jgi:hypothetical protein